MYGVVRWVSIITSLASKRCVDSLQIKYIRVPDEIVDAVKEQQVKDQSSRGGRGGGSRGDRGDRGGRGMRGRGRGRGRGGGGGA